MRIMQHVFISLALLLFASAAVTTDDRGSSDLYRVYVLSRDDAGQLETLPVDPLLRVSDGYLVLVPNGLSDMLSASGLRHELIATEVDRSNLAVHRGHDPKQVAGYNVIFREGGCRIVRVDVPLSADEQRASELAPIPMASIPIVYRAPQFAGKAATLPDNLDSLIAGVREDSIFSYAEYLESLDGRLTMSFGAYLARNYLIDKFADFGYDSVFIDTFVAYGYNGLTTGHNVIAVKPGTVNPYHHIIIGAHYDTPWAMDSSSYVSPGADDNGSGMVAVLEIARALSSVETRQTFVFILFDAEEEGLLGSQGYAERAYSRNDRIALMLNMDMIGYHENSGDAYVFWGIDSSFADLWATLADSLSGIGITAHVEPGPLSSDDGPFLTLGWPTLGIHEYVFSTVYHSYRDSTTYLNFDYLMRMARAGLATAFAVDQQFSPEPELWMRAVTQLPEMVVPHISNSIEVYVREYGDAQLIPGSVQLHYHINDGDTVSVPMNAMSYDMYTAEFPPLPCLAKVSYRITADDYTLGRISLPADESVTAFSATGLYPFYEEDFGADNGWTVSGDAMWGEWRRMHQNDYWGMIDDFDNNGWYYITGESYMENVDAGVTSLISPPIELVGQDALIEYARWYTNIDSPGLESSPEPGTEVMTVYISVNNGSSWYPVETVGPEEEADGNWYTNKFWLSDYTSSASTLCLRFDASDYGDDTYVKAAVDAIKFMTFSTDTRIMTEDVPSWTAGHPYSYQLVAGICDGEGDWSDRLGHLTGTGITLSSNGLLSGVPLDGRSIAFTARVEDQSGGFDERRFSFVIHDSLTITTSNIPTAMIGEGYHCQLSRSGGTGTKLWSDRDSDLIGSGITLSSDGLLSGTPTDAADIPFTAMVTDEVGATHEKTFTMHIIGPYVCGDATGDETIGVGDAVWIINFVFAGGPAPVPIESGDANADGTVTVADAVYIINYVFKGGAEPQCP